MASRPILIAGLTMAALASLEAFQPPDSVIFVEEPDVARKRDVAKKVADSVVARELIEFEYQLPGAADSFFNRYPDLAPSAIVPGIEYATVFAARLAERYSLPGAGLGAAHLLTDKAQLRKVATAAGIANPASRRAHGPKDVREDLARYGAVVLKPANRQASVGTLIIRDPAEVDDAWEQCLIQDEGVFVPDRQMPLVMLVEQYISGNEFSVEMLIADGSVLFANVTEQILYPGPRPIQLGHKVPADLTATQTRHFINQTERLITAVGFGTGVVHCEWILHDGTAYLVECAGRMPGDSIIEMIENAYPADIVRQYYMIMQGELPSSELPATAREGAANWFLHVEPGEVLAVSGADVAAAVPGVLTCHVGVQPGDCITEMRSAWDRVAFTTSKAPTAAEALRRSQEAISHIVVKTMPLMSAGVGGQEAPR